MNLPGGIYCFILQGFCYVFILKELFVLIVTSFVWDSEESSGLDMSM